MKISELSEGTPAKEDYIVVNKDTEGTVKATIEEVSKLMPTGSGGAIDEKAIFLAAHPIGSYWWTDQTTDPNTAYGGTWEQIKDRFVYAMGDSDTVNQTAGAKTVALTVANLAAHTHGVGSHTHSITTHAHGLNGHTHSVPAKNANYAEYAIYLHKGTAGSDIYSRVSYADNSMKSVSYIQFPGATTGGASGNTATGGPTVTGGATGDTGSAGSGTAHENMPPYICAYCWKRIA